MSDEVVLKPQPTLENLRTQRDEILALARHHRARNVRVFGSVARGDAAATSDIDLLVDFEPQANLYDVSGLRIELAELLGRTVDVVELHSRTPTRFRERILKDAVPL
jgi:predicted nucleotidyltransferase